MATMALSPSQFLFGSFVGAGGVFILGSYLDNSFMTMQYYIRVRTKWSKSIVRYSGEDNSFMTMQY
jgi:hypothetical protein